MNKERVIYLCRRYLDNSASAQELEELELILADPGYDDILERVIDNSYHDIVRNKTDDLTDQKTKERALNKILAQPQNKRPVRLWVRLAAAASVLMFLLAGVYWVYHPVKQQTAQIKQYNIAPGKNQATLTLANGQKITMNSSTIGKLAQQGNVSVNINAGRALTYHHTSNQSGVNRMEFNTLSTGRGEQSPFPLILSDGTKVWLNAASSITFPVAFIGNERKVTIIGEAYFEVSHQAEKPFRVIVQSQTVEVLGTHFNINSYTDEAEIKTTLLEGSVKVSAAGVYKIIKPGEQALFRNGEINVSEANTEEAVAWKNGYFRFNGEKIESIMRKLARWYNIEVSYEGTAPDEEYSAAISRYRDIGEVLQVLEYSKSVHFKVEGRRVTVMP